MKTAHCLSGFKETWIFPRQIFGQNSNIKFHKNPSGGSPDLCGRTDGQTRMTKLIVLFCNFANAPKKQGSAEITGERLQ